MKWIKNREKFLNEAKLRDVIFPRQAKEVSRIWGEKFLDYEEVTATDKIKQGKWKLENEDKMKVLGKFFDCNMTEVYNIFTSLNDKFASTIAQSINTDLISKESYKVIMKDFNVKNPTVDQIVIIYEPVFRKISVSETMATEVIQKDENGRPVRDEAGNMIKTQKEKGELMFTNNLVNINTFVEDFNRCFQEDRVNANFSNGNISNLRSMAKIDENSDYKVDFEIFNKDIYISISHNPKDILNMSISKFYASCQHLYSGGYREQVLGNVFDPNSIPAFLTFETPIFWGDEKISDQLPLSRMMIRNIETFNDQEPAKVFFDRAYPDRMWDYMSELVEKYTNMKPDDDPGRYLFTPDIPMDWEIQETPYMDRLGMDKGKYIGVNARTIILSSNFDWSKSKLSPKAKIEEIVIETTNLPSNFFDIPLTPEWIKIRYIKINTLQNFSKIETKSLAFDKCKLSGKTLVEYKKSSQNFEKLQIISCLVSDLKLSELGEMEEIHLIYSIDPSELVETLQGVNCKKLVLSGDLLSERENKEFINSLKKQGVKVEITGLVI